ncbi:DUF5990 family protein [Kitasatospora sp. NPDC059571]|uniref:DUF5990 family protein n=1 Tax=Kitasatospora sp. NPDC059571 TaxID=3346871 RepID=UPI00367F329B
MRIRIHAFDLPGRHCAAGPGFPGAAEVHVAVQRRGRPQELLDPQPGDAASASWTLECTATAAADGYDLRGPYVQGGPADRFVYLSWGETDAAGTFAMFRRAKLMLAAVDPDVLAAAVRSGLLVGRLGLTDAAGRPLCAQVRPPRIAWTAGG